MTIPVQNDTWKWKVLMSWRVFFWCRMCGHFDIWFLYFYHMMRRTSWDLFWLSHPVTVYRCCFIPEFDVSLYTDVVLFQNLMLVCIQMLFYSRIWCQSVYRCCFIPEFDVSLYTDVVLFQNLMLVLQYAREEKHMDLIVCLEKIPEMLDNMKHAVARMHGKLEMLYWWCFF